ncbi:hypothetical protein [Bacterioplanoides sp. SCSIO 12839]|uniref:hypothetical protein n=1 Tax=Bacterioplanoides sp. SCSIO 12839 TaxID=2829569 RepID=UPI0021066335|nr:hypothetical protein [Bacterioplanoides sp. SCSIO 12839]UTW46930.1 hypothetical protein KFF03_09995 [Bacterioplanoides sp. SCSIO 12839]
MKNLKLSMSLFFWLGLSLVLSLGLAGCGGGGSGGSSTAGDGGQPPSAPETSTPVTSIPEPETPSVTSLTTAEIEAPEGLTFTSAFAMDLSVNLEQYQQQKAYISVYSDYHQADNNQWQINYNSRILGSSVNNGVFNKALTLPQHLEKVLVQVWFYDTSIEPLTREVTVAERVGI